MQNIKTPTIVYTLYLALHHMIELFPTTHQYVHHHQDHILYDHSNTYVWQVALTLSPSPFPYPVASQQNLILIICPFRTLGYSIVHSDRIAPLDCTTAELHCDIFSVALARCNCILTHLTPSSTTLSLLRSCYFLSILLNQ